MKQRIINSKLGKFLRRVMGEDTGAIMMEYVILAVLIAAAAVVAIAYFGKGIVGGTNAATNATLGDGHKAAETIENARTVQKTGADEAVKNNKDFSDAQGEAAK